MHAALHYVLCCAAPAHLACNYSTRVISYTRIHMYEYCLSSGHRTFSFPRTPPPAVGPDREGYLGIVAVASDTITVFSSFGLGYGVHHHVPGRQLRYSEVGRCWNGHEAG